MRPLVGLPVLVLLSCGACGRQAPSAAPDGAAASSVRPVPPGPPVLVFAVDGFEWEVILPLLREGELPHLAQLVERGTAGRLATMMPNKSPRLWTTIATGKPPAEHGILDFLKEPAAGDRHARHYTSLDRRTKAFWNVLTDAGIPSDTIGWWVTYPAEEVLGTMVSQTNTKRSFGIKKGHLEADLPGQVWPPEREPSVFAAMARSEQRLPELTDEIFGLRAEDLAPNLRRPWRQCEWIFRADSTYATVLRALLDRGAPARVTTLFVGGTDVVGHRFWSAYRPETADPSPTAEEIAAFGRVVPDYYRYVDRVIGEFVGRFPQSTTVIVVADHGMRAGGHGGDDAGVFIAAGTGIRSGKVRDASTLQERDLPELGTLPDFCPTLLTLVGLPYGEDMAGRPIEALFTPQFLAAHPPTSVPTHDDAAWLESRGQEEFVLEDDERVEQLRELGYLGDE